MDATKILAVAVFALATISLGEGGLALQLQEAEPLPACPIVPFPDCRPPSVRKCDYGKNRCIFRCYCHVPCPKLECLQNAALKCENGVKLDCNGCPTCECREPCCEPCRLTVKDCRMGIFYFINEKGCKECRCKD